MKPDFITHYTFISIVLALGCVLIGILSHKKKTRVGHYLALTCFWSAYVNITYLVSILLKNYFLMSVASSLYFLGFDWILICLFAFCRSFIGEMDLILYKKLNIRILQFFAGCETVLFLINPFYELSISYAHRETAFAAYKYRMHLPYYVHLIFTYFLVFYVLFLFIYKSIKTPAQYRSRYVSIALILLFIVGLNALFLYIPGTSMLHLVDVSTNFYCLAVMLIYWSCFVYGETSMAKSLSSIVLHNIGQGVVLFDYNEQLVLKNERAEVLLGNHLQRDQMALSEFLRICHLPERQDERYVAAQFSAQCMLGENGSTPVRCDYKRVSDEHNATIGHVFVFTDTALETDLMTGFQNRKGFLKFTESNPLIFPYPLTLTALDISNLGILNSTFGTEYGDRKIRELSTLMRRHFPPQAYFVREEDAVLIAICPLISEDDVRQIIAKIREEYDLVFHYAVHTQSDPSVSLQTGINTAIRGMKNRKVLDADSTYSGILSTLLRALEEADDNTEAHVRRTRNMGADLGIRIGLSDVDRSNLSLLCVLHDIGKIGIPLEILNRPGSLSEEEWDLMKTHSEKGYQIALSSPAFSGIAELILYHHERWDGNGYPKGLSRESIPLLSRIISVVDAYDAMISDRPYRKGMSSEAACEILRKQAGSQFDPYIVSEFLQMLEEHPEYRTTKSELETDSAVVPRSAEASISGHVDYAVHPVNYCKYILDPDSVIIKVDDNFTKLTGYSVEEVISGKLTQLDLIPPADRMEYMVQLNEQLADSSIAYIEHQLLKKDGSTIYVYCIGEVYFDSVTHETRSQIIIADSMKTYTMQTLAEIEHLKARERMRHWEDTYRRDSLTGLLTRAAFQRDVELRLLNDSSLVMMLMMDIDWFKSYNDTYGHSEGDELLILLSHTLSDALRDDDLSCRMGGDEFAAALFVPADTSQEDLLHRAHQIFDRINMTMTAVSDKTGLSMGIAIRKTGKTSFNALYKDADKALYASKNNGRSRMTVSD